MDRNPNQNHQLQNHQKQQPNLNKVNNQLDKTSDTQFKNEEFSTEFTADDAITTNKDENNTETNSIIGWVAIALSALSLFMMPVLFGGAGIIVGFISRKRNVEWQGTTAIVIGVISIIISLFFLPSR